MGKLVSCLLVALLAGCPPPPAKKPGDGTTVTVDGDPPDFPGDFDPGQPLPDPAPPDPNQFGLAYLEQLYPTIRDGWAQFLEDARLRLKPDDPLNSPTLEAKVQLTLDKNGAITDEQLIAKSGNSDFDETAEEIVNDAGPFPAPPKDVLSDDEHVYVTWLFARDRRQAGIATAELRREEWPIEKSVPHYLEAGNLDEAAKRLQNAAAATTADPKSPEGKQLIELTARVMAAVLRDGLRAEDPNVQSFGIAAVTAAANADDAAAVAPASRELLSIASGSVDIANRADAITALAALGDKDAVTLIAGILDKDQGGNPKLSGAAAGAMVALGAGDDAAKLVTGWLGSGDRAKVGGGLATLSFAMVPGTAAAVAKHVTDKDVGVRVFACKALGRQVADKNGATAAWKGIKKGLDDREASVRAACAEGAAIAAEAGAHSKTAYWRLVELFKDRDDSVRAEAVRAALHLDPKASDQLGAVAKDKSPVVLAAVADGLGNASGATPKRLVELAGESDVSVRVAAVHALARRDAAARKIAAGMIVDPEQPVRLAAVTAIDDVATLDGLAKDADPVIAAASAARAIVLRGRWASLGDALTAIRGAPEDGAYRVDVAAAWLRAG